MNIDDAIAHPFFDRVRKENNLTKKVKGSKVELNFDNEQLDLNQLRKLFINELCHYEQK